jgi:hypothetical protein
MAMDRIITANPPMSLACIAAGGHMIALVITVGTINKTRGVKYFIINKRLLDITARYTRGRGLLCAAIRAVFAALPRPKLKENRVCIEWSRR